MPLTQRKPWLWWELALDDRRTLRRRCIRLNPVTAMAIMRLVILLLSKQGVAGQVANETGKRYICALCGAEFIVTRGGNGTLTCCNQPMQLKR